MKKPKKRDVDLASGTLHFSQIKLEQKDPFRHYSIESWILHLTPFFPLFKPAALRLLYITIMQQSTGQADRARLAGAGSCGEGPVDSGGADASLVPCMHSQWAQLGP